MSRIRHAARKVWISGDAVEACYDSIYGLAAGYAQRDDPWGRNPTVFSNGKYEMLVDPVIAGLSRT